MLLTLTLNEMGSQWQVLSKGMKDLIYFNMSALAAVLGIDGVEQG